MLSDLTSLNSSTKNLPVESSPIICTKLSYENQRACSNQNALKEPSIGWTLKKLGQETVKKSVISIIYIAAHTWLLCSAQILVDGVNPQ